MKDDGFTFEERDDKRTWGDGELIPDSEKVFADEPSPILEYLGEFKALIDACGLVSYFMNMKRFIAADVNKAKNVAMAYNHELRYYSDQLAEWKEKAKRSYGILSLHADELGYSMPRKSEFLNKLAVSKDRRESYKQYLQTCVKRQKTLSPEVLEAKYQRRLQNRLKKKEGK